MRLIHTDHKQYPFKQFNITTTVIEKMQNQETTNLELPPIPPLTIEPPKLNQSVYEYSLKRRQIMNLGDQQQFTDTKDEVDKKLKKEYTKFEQNSTESESTGQGSTIDITTLQRCHRCDRWINRSEMGMHVSCHAAIITHNLLLGDKFCAQSKLQLIQRMKVTHVVNAASELNNYLEDHGIKYLQLKLYDTIDEILIQQIQRAYKFIKEAHNQNGIVFVHCAVGKSRSVSVILLYLFLQKGMTMKQALKTVKQKRSIAQPNYSYMKQLLEYQQIYLKRKQQQSNPNIQKNVQILETENNNNNNAKQQKQI